MLPGGGGKGEGCGCDEVVLVDGYVLTCVLSVGIGLVWYRLMKERVLRLQRLPRADWLTPKATAKAAGRV